MFYYVSKTALVSLYCITNQCNSPRDVKKITGVVMSANSSVLTELQSLHGSFGKRSILTALVAGISSLTYVSGSDATSEVSCRSLCLSLESCAASAIGDSFCESWSNPPACTGLYFTDASNTTMCFAPNDPSCPGNLPVPCPVSSVVTEPKISAITDFTPSIEVPRLGACPRLGRTLGSGWTSTVYQSEYEGSDVAVKVYDLLNVTHFGLTEVYIYQKLEPLWGKCVPHLRFYGICEEGDTPKFVIATSMLGKSFSSIGVDSVSDALKLQAVKCMQDIMLVGGLTRIDFSLGNPLVTLDGTGMHWVDFAYSTLIESFGAINKMQDRLAMANTMAVKYTAMLWNKLGLNDELDKARFDHRARTLFNEFNLPMPLASPHSRTSIQWNYLGTINDILAPGSEKNEPISWISPRFAVTGKAPGSEDVQRIISLYGFDFAIFAHADLYNHMHLLKSVSDPRCIIKVTDFGLVHYEDGVRLAIIHDLPVGHSTELRKSSPTILSDSEMHSALRCLEDIHRSKFVNGYVRALDIVKVESTRGTEIMWKNFCYGVSNYDLFGNLGYSEADIDALIRKEQAMEFTSIQKALSDPSIVEIY